MRKIFQTLLFILIGNFMGCGSTPGEENRATEPVAQEEGHEAAVSQQPSVRPLESRQQLEAEDLLRRRVDASRCQEFLKELTRLPHLAGSKRNAQLAEYLVNTLQRFGYRIERHKYDVLLPYPVQVQVEMVEPAAFSASLREKPLELDLDTRAEAVLPYNAYSPDCDITAPVVYVNYGRREDFEQLKSLGIECRGKIVMARYGHIYRGAKASLANQYGALGLLLYSDPADDGFVKGDPYPHGRFRPASAVERGSILDISTYPGDPGTPGTASLPGSDQLTFDEMKSLPNIPTTCLSQEDARPMLENMKGQVVPKGWQGGIAITYHLGNLDTVRVRLHLEMDYSLRRIENITASLTGLRCPDEVILTGNHRDAWVHGAIDPGSGTAVLLEAARVLADANAAGQGLDRTVRFGFWDAEEFGMIGSTEYGEQFAKQLTEECVAYINVDSAVSGSKLRVAGVPSLATFANDVFASIPKETGNGHLIDDMRNGDRKLKYGSLGSGSDYAVFLEHLGIDCLDIASGGSHGVYHSTYDTYVFAKRFADPGFINHKIMAQVVATTVSRLGRARILPFDFARAGEHLTEVKERMEAKNTSLDLSEIAELAQQIANTGRGINESIAKLTTREISLELRLQLNRKIFQAGRKLLLPEGLKARPWYRHALFAPHPDKGYGTEDLPPITDALLIDDRDQAQDGATRLVAVLRGYLRELQSLQLLLNRITQS